jgi:large subunit ribosomal protein L31e
MVEKTTEAKIELEREYIVPLRREFHRAKNYKRARRAVIALEEFIAKHMKVEDRDLKKVKIDKYVNEEIWHKGIKNPVHKIKVKAVKKAGIVYVTLAEPAPIVKFRMAREEKRNSLVQKTNIKHDKANDHTEESEKIETPAEKQEAKEKQDATQEAGQAENKAQAKAQKQTQSGKHEKNTTPRRQVLER